MNQSNQPQWALVLGGSSGLGYASALKLAQDGYNICIVHRDTRGQMHEVNQGFEAIKTTGVQFLQFNGDTTRAEFRQQVVAGIQQTAANADIRCVLHSIAKGSLKPMHNANGPVLTHEDFMLTLDAMAINLYDWIYTLLPTGLMGQGSRIIALTSEGSTRPIPGYGAVAAAKAALESIVRSLAVELAPLGITANTIQAGVTDTSAMRMIPNSEKIIEVATRRNPFGRITTAPDVANVVSLLCKIEADWINGTTIVADGGESIQ